MPLVTGSVPGATTQEDLYVEGAPLVYFQDSRADELHTPDAQGFYWGLSGTTAYPVIALGCIDGVQLADNLTMNDVVCDTVGYKQTILRRNYLEVTLNISTIFPLSTIREILHGGVVTAGTGYEEMGLGPVDNTRFFHIYLPKVYDEDAPDWLQFTLHKARFVDAWTIAFRYGNQWQITGVKMRAYADDTKPTAQTFATMTRYDISALP
jgi:hypothetical protein